MARKSKSHKRQRSKVARRKPETAESRQKALASLIDEVKGSRVVGENGVNSDNKVHDPEINLANEYAEVFSKFQAPPSPSSEERTTVVRSTTILEENGDPDASDAIPPPEGILSSRKLRKLKKPALSALKASVPHPEVIEWYDRDAPDPFLLATIKSQKNIVSVPSHWQLKREYLSGRSLMTKRPFELPDIIKDTKIEEMRQTLPAKEGQLDASLKEVSRARIQPKMGTLDLDYKRLYNTFFKLGSKWKPDLLLGYGDLYYENRNLCEEAAWKKRERKVVPGKISKKLRAAMRLPEGKLPPWCVKFKELGMPPAYPTYLVAGINWEIENLTNDIYGTLSVNRGSKNEETLFGQIFDFETEDDVEEDLRERQENNEEQPKLEEHVNSYPIRSVEVKSESTTAPVAAFLENIPEEKPSDQNKPLYTVIKEKTDGTSSQLTGSGRTYEIAQRGSKQKDKDSVDDYETGNPDTSDREDTDFKY
ncbi:LAMI_0C09450g1_1 [Lachancea mirantina]|uniref:LAMI_0C09450g1_1 n=1 Tax=Lachancea mirantina TaxID=1230905 RepID=A0A1G4J5E2_9SACH|nr:LAMI_0C09450g1_1 [Lachancea mirantina]